MRDHRHYQTALGPIIREWVVELRLVRKAETTIDSYERVLALAALAYPDKAIGEWAPTDVKTVLALVPEKSRPQARSALVSFFKWAALEDRIPRNPMDRVPTIAKPGRHVVETFSDADVERLLGLPLIDGALMGLLLDGGLRRAEARRLRLRDVNLDRGLMLVHGKGSRDRIVPNPPRLVQVVSELALLEGLDPDDHLWYAMVRNAVSPTYVRRVKPVSEGTFSHWWKRCLDEARVEYRPRTEDDPGLHNPHTTRHTFAVRWLRGMVGRSPIEGPGPAGRMETLQRAMGHRSISTTIDLYGHLDVSDVERDLAAMVSGAIAP